MRFSKRFAIPSVFIVLVIGGYAVYKIVLASLGGVPEGFQGARAQGALIAQNIVGTSNDLSANLAKVEALEHEGNYTEALVLTSELAKQTVDIRKEAVALAAELEAMTRTITSVRGEEARTVALESVSNRLALISHLVTYSDGLLQLADTLRGRFTGIHSGPEVSQLIESINAEITQINELDLRAQEAMRRFDELTK